MGRNHKVSTSIFATITSSSPDRIQSTSTTSLQNRFDFRTSLGPLQRINCVPGHGLKNGLNVKVRGDYLAGLAHRTLLLLDNPYPPNAVNAPISKHRLESLRKPQYQLCPPPTNPRRCI